MLLGEMDYPHSRKFGMKLQPIPRFIERAHLLIFALDDWRLFADAKTAKDFVEHGFSNLFASDFAQRLDGRSQVNCPKV